MQTVSDFRDFDAEMALVRDEARMARRVVQHLSGNLAAMAEAAGEHPVETELRLSERLSIPSAYAGIAVTLNLHQPRGPCTPMHKKTSHTRPNEHPKTEATCP